MGTDDDYLPPVHEKKNPSATADPWKAIILWVLLVLMFVVTYQLFSSGKTDQAGRSEDSFPVVTLLIVTIGAFVLLFVFFLVRSARVARKLNHAMEPAMMAASANDYAKAEDIYKELSEKFRRHRVPAAVARNNLSDALLHQGRITEAIDEMIKVERTPDIGYAICLRVNASIELVKLFALAGETETASKWLDDANSRLTQSSNRMHSAALLCLAQVFLLCRQESFADALRLLERDWGRLESSLPAVTMREARLLRGFAILQSSSPRDVGKASKWLTPELLDLPISYLGAEWPELAATIQTQR